MINFFDSNGFDIVAIDIEVEQSDLDAIDWNTQQTGNTIAFPSGQKAKVSLIKKDEEGTHITLT